MVNTTATPTDHFCFLYLLLRSIQLYFKLLSQSINIIFYHYVTRSLESFAVMAEVVINFVKGLPVDYLVLKCQLASLVFSVVCFPISDSQLLHDLILEVFMPEEGEPKAILEHIVVLGVVANTRLHYFEN